MELACTKKLLEYIGVKAEKAPEVDPLFGWTANLLVINRRKTLVAVHAASRCVVILHGLTAKQLPRLGELLLEGIRGMLESEYVRPEIIGRYLDDLGREISFAANSSRKTVASCNKACEQVKLFSNLFKAGDLYQRDFLPRLNMDISSANDYAYACEVLRRLLRERYE